MTKKVTKFICIIIMAVFVPTLCSCSKSANGNKVIPQPVITPNIDYGIEPTPTVIPSANELTIDNWIECVESTFNIKIEVPRSLTVHSAKRVNGTADHYSTVEITFVAEDIMSAGAELCEYMFRLTEGVSPDGNYPAERNEDTGRLDIGDTASEYADCTRTVNENYFQAKWSYTMGKYSGIVCRVMIDVENVYSLITMRILTLGNKEIV